MDDITHDTIANRDEPIPLLRVSQDDLDSSQADAEQGRKRDRFRGAISGQVNKRLERSLSPRREKAESKPSLQDRLFNKLLAQVIPIEGLDEEDDGTPSSRTPAASRPAFSISLMTNNFRRFNARIGIVFVFQARMIRLFTWQTPTHTLSFLAVYTFVCLNPGLLIILPLAIALFFIMVPAFLSRHPPPPQNKALSISTPYYSNYTGPAIAPAHTIKPASETSKDFFRNMRDLQNSMADFSAAHDTMVSNIAPATNFSDEVLSSTIFLYLTIATSLLFITAHLIPWRLVMLAGGYCMTISGHPSAQLWLFKMQKEAEAQAAAAMADPSLPTHITIKGIPVPNPPSVIKSALAAMSAITVSNTPETREVEIFQLQHRPLAPLGSENAGEWKNHMYTPYPYDPLSPLRIAGDRPRGTRFLEDVQPPDGWEWQSKMWELDLEAGEWINDRLIVGVEYDVMKLQGDDDDDTVSKSTETITVKEGSDSLARTTSETSNTSTGGNRASVDKQRESMTGEFGGWVWDLPPAVGTSGNRDEEVWLAYGEYDIPGSIDGKDKSKDKSKAQKKVQPGRDWEETTRFGRGRTGEWRRRRWVRLVKRKMMRTGS